MKSVIMGHLAELSSASMGWYREWLECYISSYCKHWVDYQPIYISTFSHSPPMTPEHFCNGTLQGEKLFECFSFTLCNLIQLSHILKLPPNDTTEKDGEKKITCRKEMREGRRLEGKITNRKSYDYKNQ